MWVFAFDLFVRGEGVGRCSGRLSWDGRHARGTCRRGWVGRRRVRILLGVEVALRDPRFSASH